MSTPAGDRTPDWRVEKSRLDPRWARGCAHIRHPVSWVLAAEQRGPELDTLTSPAAGAEVSAPSLASTSPEVFMTCLTVYRLN
jgi:hypothetical protein